MKDLVSIHQMLSMESKTGNNKKQNGDHIPKITGFVILFSSNDLCNSILCLILAYKPETWRLSYSIYLTTINLYPMHITKYNTANNTTVNKIHKNTWL